MYFNVYFLINIHSRVSMYCRVKMLLWLLFFCFYGNKQHQITTGKLIFVTMEQSRSNTNTSTSVTVTKLRHKVSHRMIRGVIIKLYVFFYHCYNPQYYWFWQVENWKFCQITSAFWCDVKRLYINNYL